MGMTPRLKTVPNVPFGFPEYGMTNASNHRWGIPLASNSQRVRKRGHLFTGMTLTLKTVSNLSSNAQKNIYIYINIYIIILGISQPSLQGL